MLSSSFFNGSRLEWGSYLGWCTTGGTEGFLHVSKTDSFNPVLVFCADCPNKHNLSVRVTIIKSMYLLLLPLWQRHILENVSFFCTCDSAFLQQDTKLVHAEYHGFNKVFLIGSSDLFCPLHPLSQLCGSLLLSSSCAVCLFRQ